MNVTRINRAPEVYSITSAHSAKNAFKAGKRPRTRAGKTTECISIMPDGTTKVFSEGSQAFTKRVVTRKREVVEVRETRSQRDRNFWITGTYN